MPYLSLTTWSLHRELGPLRWTKWDAQEQKQVTQEQEQPANIRLLDLPAIVAEKGFKALEVCHFNFPSTDEKYLDELRLAFAQANVTFFTLLVDYGDISNEDETHRQADIQFIEKWIDIASKVGAERVRIIAGDAAPSDQQALARSAKGLLHLSDYASLKGVRVVTENFKPLTSIPDNCIYLLKSCENKIGLTSDFGNFSQPNKYNDLSLTIPHSESIHAKANCDAAGMPDAEEFRKCLDIVKRSGYEGPITLVYDGPGDMWAGIERIKQLAEPYLA